MAPIGFGPSPTAAPATSSGGTATNIQTITGTSGSVVGPNASGNIIFESSNYSIDIVPGTVSNTFNFLTTPSAATLPFTSYSSNTTVAANTSSAATAVVILTLPASPSAGNVCQFINMNSTSSSTTMTIQASGVQQISIGDATSTMGGACWSKVHGDSITLVFVGGNQWYATAFIGSTLTLTAS